MTKHYYRERHEIIAGMLRTISNSGTEGASKTPIMYKSFLSYAQLKEYLLFLVEKGLHLLQICDEINGIIGQS